MTLRDALNASGCTCDPTFDVEDGVVIVVHDVGSCFWAVTEGLDDLRALSA